MTYFEKRCFEKKFSKFYNKLEIFHCSALVVTHTGLRQGLNVNCAGEECMPCVFHQLIAALCSSSGTTPAGEPVVLQLPAISHSSECDR